MPNRTQPYRLRLPGPTAVPEQIRNALAAPVVSHRGPEFKEILTEVNTLAKPLFGTTNDIMTFACSGTGLMEASIANILGTGDKVLILINGYFGERYAQITLALGLQADTLELSWGEAVCAQAVAEKLRGNDYRAVIAVHNESSTGVVLDLAAIGEVVRETDALLVVDSISGVGGLEINQDAWGIDILISASQKSLMCPPGLGLVSVSEKAWKVIDGTDDRASFYWDFRRARDAAEIGQTPFTSSISLTYGLRIALRMIHAEGLPNVLTRHARLSAAMRAGGRALGFSIFATAPILSNTVCVFALPEGLDGAVIVGHMYKQYRTVIAGALSKLNSNVIRIGTMGGCTEDDIRTDLKLLEQTLGDVGWPVESGAGVAALDAFLHDTSWRISRTYS
jgi:aspartate aminotransferase-like enzyme